MVAVREFFKCVALASLKVGLKMGVNAAGLGLAVDIAVEVHNFLGPRIREWWGNRPSAELLPLAQELAVLPLDKAAQLAEQAVDEVVKATGENVPVAMRNEITAFMAQIAPAFSRSLSQVANISGRSRSQIVVLREPEDLLALFPQRMPRFKPGDRPAGIGDWQLEELLGVGGFGEVWKARNPHMPSAEPVALKFCLDPSAAKALRNEVALLEQVKRESDKQKGFVQLLRTYLSADPPCLEYEYVDGGNLARLIAGWHRGPRPDLIQEAAGWMGRLAGVVGLAHSLNPPVVHRDLKPANILIQMTGRHKGALRVADFGIGGIAADAARQGTGEPSHPMLSSLLGACTPLYASPEQQERKGPDPRDDVYSLGVIWFQMLTGKLGVRPGTDWRNHLPGDMPAGMRNLLGRCLAPRREDRPNDARQLAENLDLLLKANASGTQTVSDPPSRPEAIKPAIAPVKEVPRTARGKTQQVAKPQPSTPDLPPLPEQILQLERQLERLEQAAREFKEGTHESLRSAQRALRAAEEEVQQAQAEIDRYRLTRPTAIDDAAQKRLERALLREPPMAKAELCDLVPKVLPSVLLPFLPGMRDRLRALKQVGEALEAARKKYEQDRQQQIQSLQKQASETRKTLLTRQEEDFEIVLTHLFEAADSDEFPVDRWVENEQLLVARRYGFATNPRELLRRAEEYHQDDRAWKRASKRDTVEAYVGYLTNSAGRHKVEARLRRDDRAWHRAEQIDTAEGYEKYLSDCGARGRYAQEATNRAARVLRVRLLGDLEDVALRKRYLAVRTPELKAWDRDHPEFHSRPIIWAINGVIRRVGERNTEGGFVGLGYLVLGCCGGLGIGWRIDASGPLGVVVWGFCATAPPLLLVMIWAITGAIRGASEERERVRHREAICAEIGPLPANAPTNLIPAKKQFLGE